MPPKTDYFAQLSPSQKAELFRIYARNGIYKYTDVIDHYNKEVDRMKSSTDKNFVRRLNDPEGSPYIDNNDGTISTHKMASGYDKNDRNVMWPTIQQDKNGQLVDYGETDDWGLENAISNNDTLQFNLPSLAGYFGVNYKTHYPNVVGHANDVISNNDMSEVGSLANSSSNIYSDGGSNDSGPIKDFLRRILNKNKQQETVNTKDWERQSENTSKTRVESEQIEDKMNDHIRASLKRNRKEPYMMPYDKDQRIVFNGSSSSINLLDSLAKYAGIHNLNPRVAEKPIFKNAETRKVGLNEAVGLMFQETHGGALPAISIDIDDPERRRQYYNANYLTAYGQIPAYGLVNNYHWLENDIKAHPLLDAIRYYAEGDYNRGNKNHGNDVKNTGTAFLNTAAGKKWKTERGDYWIRGINPDKK